MSGLGEIDRSPRGFRQFGLAFLLPLWESHQNVAAAQELARKGLPVPDSGASSLGMDIWRQQGEAQGANGSWLRSTLAGDPEWLPVNIIEVWEGGKCTGTLF